MYLFQRNREYFLHLSYMYAFPRPHEYSVNTYPTCIIMFPRNHDLFNRIRDVYIYIPCESSAPYIVGKGALKSYFNI